MLTIYKKCFQENITDRIISFSFNETLDLSCEKGVVMFEFASYISLRFIYVSRTPQNTLILPGLYARRLYIFDTRMNSK